MKDEHAAVAIAAAERRCAVVAEALHELDHRRALLEQAARVAEALRRAAVREGQEHR